MALRVPKAELPAELRENLIKQLGSVPEPVEVMWHNLKVAQASLELGAKAGAWNAADDSLKTFAHMAVAAQVGCSWCLDINYFQAQNQSLDLTKASQVPRWRESDVFTPLERDVLEYAGGTGQPYSAMVLIGMSSLTWTVVPAALVLVYKFIPPKGWWLDATMAAVVAGLGIAYVVIT